jgi:hypothetical protein
VSAITHHWVEAVFLFSNCPDFPAFFVFGDIPLIHLEQDACGSLFCFIREATTPMMELKVCPPTQRGNCASSANSVLSAFRQFSEFTFNEHRKPAVSRNDTKGRGVGDSSTGASLGIFGRL